MKKIFTLLCTIASFGAISQSTTVVISQAFGGGGGTTGTYKYDYVELFNRSAVAQDISGFQIMYGSATGQFGSSPTAYYTIPSSTIIPARKYLLIQLGAAGTGGADLPVTADLITTNIAMSGTNGKVALVTSAFTANTCGATATPCTIPSATIIDLVAYGTANNAEGGSAVTVLTSTSGAVRKLAGDQDTDNNLNDFDVVTAPVPRNSSTIAPLSLTVFSAALANEKVVLSWSTSNESNVNGFDIEKSVDGISYTSLQFISAKNGVTNSYSFIDNKLNKGVNYYRLKMIDKDGSFKYSKIVALSTIKSNSPKLDIFPNPVASNLTVSHEKTTANAAIKVVTVDGKVVLTRNLQAGATQSTIDVSKLIKGNYLVVFTNDGTTSSTQFVKQ